ncbi:hypothetical protein [uncultured Thomasclavelia sp.]|uniref:hypothetical protein n=1 Tax=uncultured Thomasclavelia sp. TaxID=3025759 RepID=UPI0025D0755A|nr:hypothetical protein [uncultured Thomasclavelia sp.]
MFKEGYKFFEQSLKNEELTFYQRCYRAIKNRQMSIIVDFKQININRAREIIKYVYEDNPSFFYLSPYKLSYNDNGCIYFNYIYDKTTTINYENQIKKILMHFFDDYQILKLPKYNQILIFHNCISSLANYDQIVSSGGSGVDEDYNIIGFFQGKVAVCYGFSLVFKLLCDYSGINCLVIRGKTKGNHAWNMVEYNGKFYHIDTTWDLLEDNNNVGIYKFFMVDDLWIKKSRTINAIGNYPKSYGLQYTYYVKNKYMVNDINNLSQYFYERLKEYPNEIFAYVTDKRLSWEVINRSYREASDKFRQLNNHNFKSKCDKYWNSKYGIVRIILGG